MADLETTRVEKGILLLVSTLNQQNADRLPAEAKLIEDLETSRHTLRKVIERFVSEGVLQKIQGKGTFIVGTKKSIDFSGWIGTEPPGDVFVRKMSDSFETSAPGYRLHYTPIPYYQTVEQLVRLAVTGRMPDVMQLVPHFTGILSDFDLLLPLDRYVNHNDLKKRYPIDVESGRMEKKLLSLSWALSPLVLYCNRNVLARAGLDPDTIPASLDELFEICVRVNSTGDSGSWGICLPVTSNDPAFLWLYPYFLSFRGGFSDALGNITVDSAENTSALRWITDLFRKGAVPGSKGVHDGRILFASDRIAFWIDGPWMKGLFRQLSSHRDDFDTHYNIAKIPVGPSGRSESILFSHHLAVSQQCRDIDSAYRWIDFLTTNEEFIEYYFISAGCLPPMRDILDKPIFRNDPFASVCIDQMDTVSTVPLNQRLFTRSLSFVSQSISRVVTGQVGPEQVLDELKTVIHMIRQSAFLGIYSH